MATRRLFLAARVARGALDGWLPDAAVLVVGRPDRGGRRSGRAPVRRDRSTHDVHDLGDASLLPGFVETHVHMHFPVAARLPGDRPAGTCRTDAHPRDRQHAPPAGLRRDDRSGHRQPRRGRARDPLGDPRRHRGRAAPAGRRRPDHDHRRPLLVPRRRGGHAPKRSCDASASDASLGVDVRQGHRVGWRLHADVEPALAAVRPGDDASPPSPRRIGWGCRSWPIR